MNQTTIRVSVSMVGMYVLLLLLSVPALGQEPPPPEILTQEDFGATPETNDHFGMCAAVGDFNGDGYQDLAAGTPLEDWSGDSNVGLVSVAYGSASGLGGNSAFPGESFFQDIAGASIEAGDQFGFSLACGDFNGDTYDDLAAGAPYEDVDGENNAGSVIVIYGSSAGLNGGQSAHFLTQITMSDMSNEEDDRFGFALAAGRFTNDQYDDLAIGSPGEDIQHPDCFFETNDVGSIAIVYGSASGLDQGLNNSVMDPLNDFDDNLEWDCDDFSPDLDWRFGECLASGDFDADQFGLDDLAVGIPGYYGPETSYYRSGLVTVAYPADYTHGLEWFWYTFISRPSDDGDRFGLSLATGNFNDDQYDDLAIGSPFYDFYGDHDCGRLTVVLGTENGVVDEDEFVQQYLQFEAGNESWGTDWDWEEGDQWTFCLSGGDLNGDGYGDLAVGANLEDIGTISNAGMVGVMLGSPEGLAMESSPPSVLIDQEASGVAVSESNDQFGRCVAIGDFNGDDVDDLAIGASNEEFSGGDDQGVICVVYGPIGEQISDVDYQTLPKAIALGPNVPNPFNPMTVIAFELPSAEFVRLSVLDVSGKLVRVLAGGDGFSAGYHEVRWDGRDDVGRQVAAGVYLYRLDTGVYSETKKMVLVR